MARLANALGLSRRSIQSAINELRRRGAIDVAGRVGSRNKYVFHLPANEIKIGRSVVKSASRHSEASFRKPENDTSPEKRKEKKKKRDTHQKDSPSGDKTNNNQEANFEVGTARHHRRFLDDVTKRLRNLGLSDEVLIAIKSSVPENAYQAFCQETQSREAAIEEIAEACLSFIKRSP